MLSGNPQPLPSVTALLRSEGDEGDTVEDYLLAREDRVTSHRPLPLAELGPAGSLEDLLFVVRQFLDDFRRPQAEVSRRALIERQPPFTRDGRRDALVGALAEHLANDAGWAVPAWAQDERRFLSAFWFVHEPAFDALALVQSPAAFRRRGIFLSADFLSRV